MRGHKGFTLLEVLTATAIAGLTITAGFRLIAMSYNLLGAVEGERALITAAQTIWMRFRTDKEMPSSDTDDELNLSWEAKDISVSVEDYELRYRRITIKLADGRETDIYVAE